MSKIKKLLLPLTILCLALLSACQLAESDLAPVATVDEDIEQAQPVKSDQAVPDNSFRTELLQYEMETEVNEIKMTVKSFILDPENDQILLKLRFEYPTESDWMPDGVVLTVDGREYKTYATNLIEFRKPAIDGKQRVDRMIEGEIISMQEDESSAGAYREDLFIFEVESPEIGSSYAFQVGKLAFIPYEGEECTESYLKRAQAMVDALDPTIKIDCRARYEPMSGFVVLDPPEGFDQFAFFEKVFPTGGVEELDTIYGPWTFEIKP